MPESDTGERTEQATPRRRQDAREKGQVAKSTDLTVAISLLGTVVLLQLGGGTLLRALALVTRKRLDSLADGALSAQSLRLIYGQGIGAMVGLVREIAHLTEAPVIAQPNAGLPKLVRGRTLYEDDPSAFAAHLAALHEAGAQIIGGCCGTTEEHVRAIRRLADGLQARR